MSLSRIRKGSLQYFQKYSIDFIARYLVMRSLKDAILKNVFKSQKVYVNYMV